MLLPAPASAEGSEGRGHLSITAEGRVTSARYSAFPVDRTGAQSPEADERSARARLIFALEKDGGRDGMTWEAEVEAGLVDGALSGQPLLAGDDLPGDEVRDSELHAAWLSVRKGRKLGLKVGLMGSDWGLGLVANSGTDPKPGVEGWFKQPRVGDRVLRVALFGMPVPSLLLVAAADQVWEDDIASYSEGDRARQGVFAVRQFFARDRWIGMYVVRREQEEEDGKTLSAMVADIAADFTFDGWRARFEGALITGETTLGATRDHPTHNLVRYASALRLIGNLGGGLTADLEGAWLSGDETMDDGTSSAFKADRNFQQGLVLYPRVLATWSGRARRNASNLDVVGVPADDLDKLSSDGALSGVVTLFPKLGWKASPGLEIYAGTLLSWATGDVLDPFNTRTGGGTPVNHLGRVAQSSYLGTEFDFGLRMSSTLPWNLGVASVTAEYGVLAPGGGLAGLDDVHGGRLTLSLSESQEKGR